MAGASDNEFTAWDWVVFAVVLGISTGIGVFFGCFGKKQTTTEDILMGGRSMSVFPVTLSLLASFMSAITLLGTPAEIYLYGTQYWMIWIGYIIMIPLAAHLFLPIFFNLGLTSVFEYLELRFNTAVRILASVFFIVQMVMYMAIVLYAPSLALSAVTGINKWIGVFSVGVVCTFYTTLGGMKAVMWTDVFQIFMMFGGLIAILVKGAMDHGGFSAMWGFLEQSDRVEFFNWDPNPLTRHSIWSLSFGGCFTWLAIFGVNQAMVQRTLCVPTLRQGQLALWLNLPGLTLLLTVCALCGMVVYAQYRDCDPLLSGRIEATDQLLPLYVMDALNFPGLPGLFTACLFSGALSTISSGLNSLSAVLLQDMIKKFCYPKLSESRATLATKIIALSFGVLMIALTFVAAELGGVLQAALALFGMIGGPVLGVFFLGICYPWANSKGALSGMVVSLVLTLWLGIGANVYRPTIPQAPRNISGCPLLNLTDTLTTTADLTTTPAPPPHIPENMPGYTEFYEVSYLWYCAFAVILVVGVGLPVSFITGADDPTTMDPRLFCPILYNMCMCLPESIRHILRCGVPPNMETPDPGDLKRGLAELGGSNDLNSTADTQVSDLRASLQQLDTQPSHRHGDTRRVGPDVRQGIRNPGYQPADTESSFQSTDTGATNNSFHYETHI